jgi:hypothetical protein
MELRLLAIDLALDPLMTPSDPFSSLRSGTGAALLHAQAFADQFDTGDERHRGCVQHLIACLTRFPPQKPRPVHHFLIHQVRLLPR